VVATLADGEVLVAGGESASGEPLSSAELYDPTTGTWKATGPFVLPASRATATVLGDGEVLVAGGLSEKSGTLTVSAAAQRYNPKTGSWSLAGSLPVASYDASAVLLGSGEVLYSGGFTAAGATATASAAAAIFNPATGSWTATGTLPVGVAEAASGALPGGGALVAGGETAAGGNPTAQSETYDPAHGRWSAAAPLPHAVAQAACTRLANGTLLVAGGETAAAGDPTSASALYQPSSSTWASTGSLPLGTFAASATTLRSGLVLYAGGFTAPSTASRAAALYDPGTGAWTATGQLGTARGAGVAAAVGSGALVAGGSTGTQVTASSELFAAGSAPSFVAPTTSVTFRPGSYASLTVRASGSPVPAITLAGTLPPGMAFHQLGAGAAVISGTPSYTSLSSYSVTLTASSTAGSVSERVAIAVAGPPSITSPDLLAVDTVHETAFSVVSRGVPTPRLSESGALPPGLAFSVRADGTAAISGRASVEHGGTWTVTVVAVNGVGDPAVQRLRIVVSAPLAPRLAAPSFELVRAGAPTSFSLSSSGYPTPQLSISGSLPNGLSFRPGPHGTATIAGVPATTSAGTYVVEVVATNGVGSPAVRQLKIEVTLTAGLRVRAVVLNTVSADEPTVAEQTNLDTIRRFVPASERQDGRPLRSATRWR